MMLFYLGVICGAVGMAVILAVLSINNGEEE